MVLVGPRPVSGSQMQDSGSVPEKAIWTAWTELAAILRKAPEDIGGLALEPLSLRRVGRARELAASVWTLT